MGTMRLGHSLPAPSSGGDPDVAFRWPTGPWMLTILVLTTIGSAAFLGTLANPMASVGWWGYAAWLIAAGVCLLASRSVTMVLAKGRPAPEEQPDDLFSDLGPPVVRRFRARMGGWGAYIGAATQVIGHIAATSAVVLLMGRTIFPGQATASRAAAVAGIAALAVARILVREPRRGLTVLVVSAALVGLVWVGVHLQTVRPGTMHASQLASRVSPDGFLEATALLPLAFLPVLRMSVMLPGVRSVRRRQVLQRWVMPLTALTAVALAAALGDAVGGVLPSTDGTVLAQAVSDCPAWVRVTLLAVTLVLGAVFALILLDDSQLVASRVLRDNAIRDIFAAPRGRRASTTGEAVTATAAAAGVAVAPGPQELIAFSAFCVIMLFGTMHVAALRLSGDDRWRRRLMPMAGLVGSGLLGFYLPPEAILAGIVVVSLAVLVRSVFIAWSEPLAPDIVEGVGASASAARRPEDAAGDLPADDGAR